MALREDTGAELVRLRILLLVMLAGIGLLIAALWRIQVAHGARYEDSRQKQSLRRVRLPAPRGRIFDRHGVCLADNRPGYNIALYLEEIRQRGRWQNTVDRAMSLVRHLALVLGREPEIEEQAVWTHIRKRLPLPLVLWRDVDAETLARFAEHAAEFDGVDIEVDAVRRYPQGSLAAHVLGYVGSAQYASDADEPYHFYLPDIEGKRGAEIKFNDVLAGAPGGRLLRIDASGFKHAERAEREPRPGRDLWLALDSRIQRLAEQALLTETGAVAGAVVVLAVRSGDILALASSPTFDPNRFVAGISADEWARIVRDAGRPLINRVTGEIYAPGSVFKPVVAIAALESQRATDNTTFACPGYFSLGAVKFRCWNPNGHGTLAMRKAFEQSCNSYFCALGSQCGIAAIHAQAAALGFGRKTGIDSDYEVAGILPDDAWKRKHWRDRWRPGDTCNVSIGQGALAVTPLQVAVMAAAIANGGALYRPRLALGVGNGKTKRPTLREPRPERVLPWSEHTLDVVRQGMRDVIQSPAGTGQRARLDDIAMAGKTGTAEFGLKGAGKKHTWMMVFAPYDNPLYAVVIVLDLGETGGRSVAPLMHGLMDGIFHGEEAHG
jgi:penicillin-binding protein 2